MIYAQPATTFEAFLQGAPTGLVGTLTFRLIDPSDLSVEIAASTTGITEVAAGAYRKSATAPTVADTYLIVWNNGGAEFTEELVVTTSIPGPVATDYRPSLAEVGVLIRARTKDTNGNRIGTFNANTNPTGDQVEELIDRAVIDVRRLAGVQLESAEPGSDLLNGARELAALRAAMYVELSYFPEQANDENSSYGRLKEMWDETAGWLVSSLTSDPGDIQGFGSVAVMSPTAAAYVEQLSGFDPFLPPAA